MHSDEYRRRIPLLFRWPTLLELHTPTSHCILSHLHVISETWHSSNNFSMVGGLPRLSIDHNIYEPIKMSGEENKLKNYVCFVEEEEERKSISV